MTDCTKKGPLYCSICDAKDQRIRELEDEIKRYKRIVPGTPATESQWLALVTRAETAEQRIRELEDGLEEALYMLGAIDLDGNVAPEYHDPDPDAMKPGVRRALNAYTGHMEALADE